MASEDSKPKDPKIGPAWWDSVAFRVTQFVDWLRRGFQWVSDGAVNALRDVRGAVVRLIALAAIVGFCIVLLPTLCRTTQTRPPEPTVAFAINVFGISIPTSGTKKSSDDCLDPCQPKGGAETFATAGIWALACLASGLFAGFLFGIPKVHQELPGNHADKVAVNAYNQQVNNNLVEVSDWLCKIIVGVGLIELRNVPDRIDQLAAALSRDLGMGFSHAYAGGLIVYFIALGFLSGYILTRLFMAKEFRNADLGAAGIPTDVVDKIEHAKEEAIRRMKLDLAIVQGKIAQTSSVTDEFVKSAIEKLEDARKDYPADRKAAIVLGSLYRKQSRMNDAVKMLREAFAARVKEGLDKDVDAAAITFNLACYLGVIRLTAPEEKQPELKRVLLAQLRHSFTYDPTNVADAQKFDDGDLKEFKDDPDFLALIAEFAGPTAVAPPAGPSV